MILQRNLLLIFLLFITVLILKEWDNDKKNSLDSEVLKKINKIDFYQNDNIDKIGSNEILITTDVLKLKIDKNGGNIIKSELLNYSDKLFSKKKFRLLETTKNFIYNVQSGFVSDYNINNFYNSEFRQIYSSNKNSFFLDKYKNNLSVPLVFINSSGVIYKKIYIFKRGKYDVLVKHIIQNNTNNPLKLFIFCQLKQSIEIPKEASFDKSLNSYRGAAFSTDNNSYKKYSFKEIAKNDLHINTRKGWIAMLQQYFAVAWIPSNLQNNIFYTSNTEKNIAIVGYKTDELNVNPNSEYCYSSKLWIGPEIQSDMASVAPNLDLTVDYGFLWFISQPLFKLLKLIHSFVGNWGFSIVIITFIVRVIMYPLTKAQYISMAKMRLLQPKIIDIKNKFGSDKQKMSYEIINLYKKEKVNPLGGCFLLIIQMPIFLALYYMLMGSIELRHAHFIFWIKDLSSKDPYYVLPLLMGLMMFVFQKISPSALKDNGQKTVVMYMPIIFTVFFLWFPSGLVLYYIVSNFVTAIQQRMIYQSLKKRGLFNF